MDTAAKANVVTPAPHAQTHANPNPNPNAKAPLPPAMIIQDANLSSRIASMEANLSLLVRQQEKTTELIAEMTPILREMMTTATTKLDDLDKKGYFAFGKELVGVGERIIEGFSLEDVRRLGDAAVGILQTVRAMTQPRILEIASEASEVLETSEKAEPLGLFGMVRATGDDDVQKGMAVMMEVMRHVGRVARAVEEQRKSDPSAEKKAKLAAVLGPRMRKPVLGIERRAAASAGAQAVSAAASSPRRATSAATSATPIGSPPLTREIGAADVGAVIDGVAFGPDGHLADPGTWTPALAEKLAVAQGITLDEVRWSVVTFARTEFERTTTSPNIRRLTQGTSLATKDIYTLFPKAPARTIAKIAGIPKPAGCI